MPWPPEIGELLPLAEQAYNVREKLRDYALRVDHPQGGPKASGFKSILGITADDLEYLASAVLTGVRSMPVIEIRDRGKYGVHCTVIVPTRGLGTCTHRVVGVLTAWEIRFDGDSPRLITAYIASTLS